MSRSMTLHFVGAECVQMGEMTLVSSSKNTCAFFSSSNYKPCTIGTLVPAATVSITGKRECGTYNEALEAKIRELAFARQPPKLVQRSANQS
ncbi:hypothetical protein CSKR_107838 [Clonorchis sinensis]|uniref:Uncharacterized protein n=1 Tax=Clonorchis sinensis TaxID=79923 RepID=A0A3R7GA63_CLOSI|nr:hypothetical protein CSKR_107838 [Clonorchis sinensis]